MIRKCKFLCFLCKSCYALAVFTEQNPKFTPFPTHTDIHLPTASQPGQQQHFPRALLLPLLAALVMCRYALLAVACLRTQVCWVRRHLCSWAKWESPVSSVWKKKRTSDPSNREWQLDSEVPWWKEGTPAYCLPTAIRVPRYMSSHTYIHKQRNVTKVKNEGGS